jgi:uncharacterized protein YbaR (Trm112 family)
VPGGPRLRLLPLLAAVSYHRSIIRAPEAFAMRRDLVDILACPICHQPLELHVEQEQDGEVLEGRLQCTGCNEEYPISEGIPNLLPPDLRRAMAAEAGGGSAH